MADKEHKTRPLKEIVRTMAQENTGRASYKEEEVPKEKTPEPEKKQNTSSEEINAKRIFKDVYVPQRPEEDLYLRQERYY